MEYQDKKAYSEVGPIGRVDALASILSISAESLLAISSSVESFRISGKTLRKKSGELRPTSNAIVVKIITRMTTPQKVIENSGIVRLAKLAHLPDFMR